MTEEQANYWYPKEKGEQNEILHQLQANVIHPSLLTKCIDKLPCIFKTLIFVGIFLKTLKMLFTPNMFTEYSLVHIFFTLFIFLLLISYLSYKKATTHNVYLYDFSIAEMDDKFKMPVEKCVDYAREQIGEESYQFVNKLVKRTGLGQKTAYPDVFRYDHWQPRTMQLCREEVYQVMENCCDKLFKQTQIDPTKDIDCVIANCSIFNPTPSMAAMIINKYKLKQTCKGYHLGGMGCSASIIACDMAVDYLYNNPNSTVLVFSTETITDLTYGGKDRSKLMTYTLFRMGAAAILLTNKKSLISKSKYKFERAIRLHNAIENDAHNVIFYGEDKEDNVGVTIGRTLIDHVSKLIKQNMQMLLPLSLRGIEKIKYSIMKMMGKDLSNYKFNVRKMFQGYCIHAGGRGVIDAVQKEFELTNEDCMSSRAGLCQSGNTSSPSIWYELTFIERTNMLKKGDKLLQMAFGSGIKANTCVWEKINDF